MKMRTKILFLGLISLFLFMPKNSQAQKQFDCDVILNLFKTKLIKTHFFPKRYKNMPIIIVDTGHVFNSCSFPLLFGRRIILVSDSLLTRSKRNHNFEVYRADYSKGVYTLVLMSKYSGILITYEFKKSHGKYATIKVESGNF